MVATPIKSAYSSTLVLHIFGTLNGRKGWECIKNRCGQNHGTPFFLTSLGCLSSAPQLCKASYATVFGVLLVVLWEGSLLGKLYLLFFSKHVLSWSLVKRQGLVIKNTPTRSKFCFYSSFLMLAAVIKGSAKAHVSYIYAHISIEL